VRPMCRSTSTMTTIFGTGTKVRTPALSENASKPAVYCWLTCITCGSDGARTFTYDFSALTLYERQEIVDPIRVVAHKNSQSRYSAALNQIPQEKWVEVAQRHVNGESLRQLGRIFHVSHEAIRQIVKNSST
jgi:hypothetical protein